MKTKDFFIHGFEPDYNNILSVLNNRKPARLPLYEHHIDLPFISKALGKEIDPAGSSRTDLEHFYRQISGFWKSMSYDAFDYEAAVCEIFPGHGAISGGVIGPIQDRSDFNSYPFEELPRLFWKKYTPHLEAIREVTPPGMKAFGGCGYGIFESAEDLVGYENLAVLQYTDPELFTDLFVKIGDLYEILWTGMVKNFSDIFVFFRMGDDLGFKNATLLEPDTIRNHILPQYKRVIDIVHRAEKKFLLHSCGNIFSVMDDIVNLGIDAKHSNEDEIAPFETWIENYNDKIGLLGGIDVNILCLETPEDIFRIVIEKGLKYREMSNGYGLGSGNSIAEYVPVEGFHAMIRAAEEIRKISS